MASILITGVSTGIGNALARYHLARGDEVLAVSRNPAANIPPQEHFHFMRCDLTDIERAPAILQTLLSRTTAPVETVYLNAGRFGGAPQLATQTSMQEFNSVLALNLGAVKMVLDIMLSATPPPSTVVFSSSISALRQRAGMLSYSVSKAALNALAKIYQLENPHTFFAVLGLCNVQTTVARTIMAADERFSDLVALRQRAAVPGYIVDADSRAGHIVQVLAERHRNGLKSGEFQEIRDLLNQPLKEETRNDPIHT